LELGCICCWPETGLLPLQPLEAVQLVAFWLDQETIVDCPS
jgi:hypothetical protein